jgi:hypothetical protein
MSPLAVSPVPLSLRRHLSNLRNPLGSLLYENVQPAVGFHVAATTEKHHVLRFVVDGVPVNVMALRFRLSAVLAGFRRIGSQCSRSSAPLTYAVANPVRMSGAAFDPSGDVLRRLFVSLFCHLVFPFITSLATPSGCYGDWKLCFSSRSCGRRWSRTSDPKASACGPCSS